MDECYCALCGVSFGILTDLYHDRVSDDEVAWTEFFRLRTFPFKPPRARGKNLIDSSGSQTAFTVGGCWQCCCILILSLWSWLGNFLE